MIHARLPFFPPSINHAYFQRGKARVLTAAGKKFKVELKAFLAREHQEFLSFFKKDKPYMLIIRLNMDFDKIMFRGWPNKAAQRYKALDASNYVKVLEDALSEACGYDDRQNVAVASIKVPYSAGYESDVELWAISLEDEPDPLYAFST